MLRMKVTLTIPILVVVLGAARVAAGEGSAPSSPHKPNPKLTTLAPGKWVKVAPQVPVGIGIMAYSGGVFDPGDNCFLLFGGGHGDCAPALWTADRVAG